MGRVIHSNRHAPRSAWIGGVAVYARPLPPERMKSLANVGRAAAEPPVICLADILGGTPSWRGK
jgi:hypothetical protein